MPNYQEFKKISEKWKLLVAADVVAFSFFERKLQVLLVKRHKDPGAGKWALPGGFVTENESLEQAALRELGEETGLDKKLYLEQLYTFGDPKRDPRAHVISVAYLLLISDPMKLKLKAGTDAKEVAWFPVEELPELAFGDSHREILEYAWQRLKWKFTYTNVACNLLTPKFPLTALQRLYEAVYGRKIDKRNFRKKILSLDMVAPLEEYSQDMGRPAQLYRAATKKLLMYERVF